MELFPRVEYIVARVKKQGCLLVHTWKLDPSIQYFMFLKNGKYLASNNELN